MKKFYFLATVLAATMAFTACEKNGAEDEGGEGGNGTDVKNAMVIGDKVYSLEMGTDTVLYNDGLWEIYLNGYEWGAIGHGAPNSGDINFTEGLLGQEVDLMEVQDKEADRSGEFWNIFYERDTIMTLEGYMNEGLFVNVDGTTQLTFKKAVMKTSYDEKTNSFTIDINGEFSNGQKFSLNKEFKTVIASYAFNTSDNYYDYSPSDSVSYHALFKPFTGNMFKLVAPSPSKADKEAAYNQARAIFKGLVESIDQEKIRPVQYATTCYRVELLTWGYRTDNTMIAYVQLTSSGFSYVESCNRKPFEGAY